MESIQDQFCPKCQTKVEQTDFFCPRCGAKLKEKPLSQTILRQVYLYFFSFFFAPLGLYHAVKYLKDPSPKSKKIGVAIISITILSILLMTYLYSSLMSKITQSIDPTLVPTYNELGL